MTRYWLLGLLIAAAAVIYLVRRLRERRETPLSVDIPLEQPARSMPEVVRLLEVDDTAPAILSPPEWKLPKKAA